MTTITTGSLITDEMPQTEAILLGETTIDYASAKLRAIAMAKYAVYGSEPADTAMDPRVVEYVAKLALFDRLVPFAIDYFMTKARLSDSKEGATVSYHNRVDALTQLREALAEWLKAHEALIKALVDGNTASATSRVLDVSTLHEEYRETPYLPSPDPFLLAERWR